ncbi:MAG: cytidylate kinase-like family protein, partial [Acidimicrobiales bacterium]
GGARRVGTMAPEGFEPLVTVSAAYGAGGSIIARRLAERLGLPFVDRAISAELSQDAAASAAPSSSGVLSQEGLTDAEEAATPGNRILAYFARAASVGAMLAPDPIIDTDDVLRERSEAELAGLARGASGLLLGRAGAVVLAKRPRAFHIRLDGPVERRIRLAAGIEHLDLDRARRRQEETDRARALFVKRLYRADPADPRWYHVVLDSTVFALERSVALLAEAATAYFAPADDRPAGPPD